MSALPLAGELDFHLWSIARYLDMPFARRDLICEPMRGGKQLIEIARKRDNLAPILNKRKRCNRAFLNGAHKEAILTELDTGHLPVRLNLSCR